KKRQNGNKKPKWNMRKLSIGLVSCLLGFSMLINSGANVYAKEVLNENDKANMRDSGKKVEDSTGTKNSKLPKDKKLTIDEKSKDLITGKKDKKLDTDKKEKATITHPYKTNEKTHVNKLVEEKNNKIKTATPTNLKQDYDDITSKEVIVGKAPANSDIKLKNSKGTVLATTKAKTDGTFSITIPNTVKHGDKLTVTATENGKAESDNSKEVIIDKLAPTAPAVEDIYEEDKEITINLPNDVEVGDKIRIWLPDDKYVEVDLTSEMVAAKKAKIGIPQGTALKKDKQITVQLMDKVGNTSDVVAKNIKERKSKKEKTATPTDVKQDYDDNTGKAVITGKAPANSEVKLKNSNGDVVATTTAKPDGTFSIPIPNTVKDGDKVTVTATETGKTESEKSNEVVIDLKDPSAPTIEDVYVGDKEVTVNLPNDVEVGDKVRVTLPNGKRVEVELTAEMIAAKKAKVGIPEGITLKKDEQVTVQLMDKAGNTSDVIVTKVKEKEFDKEKIAKIEIKTPPTKTKYTEGEKFDPAGMVVTLTDENGKKVDVPAEKFAEYGITVPTENLTKDQTKVEVKVKNKKAEQPITVKEKEFDKEKIANIEIKTPPTKTKYTEGEKFDPAGMVVTLTDENGKKVDVPAEKFAEYGITVPTENLTKDQTKVEVKVKNKKAEQPITVKEKEFDKEKIANIEIKTPPTKTKYTEGEKFDPAGMVVTLTDENGKKVDVPAEKFAEYGITVPTENLTKDQTKVEVKVKNKKAEQPITVKEKEFDKEKIANIEIKTPPTKTKYTEGEKFDPAGMVVTLTDENGKKVDVPAEKFAEYGITVPTENLTKDQTKVEVKVKDKKAEQPITVTPKVSKTEIPVINNAKAGDKKITGTAEPGATLTVTTPEGVKTVVAGADGKWEITLGTPLAEGNVIKAVAKVNGKGASNEASITVGKAKPIADQVTPAIPKEKTPVENPTNLTKEEKEIVKKKVKEVNKGNFPNGTKVEIGTDGTATITYPDNSQDKIKGRDLVVKKKVKPIADQITPAIPKEKTPVENPTNLTKEEKEIVKKKVEKANKGNFPNGTKVEIGTDGTATITYPDNSQDKIKGSDLVVKKKIISNKPTNKKLPKTSITGTSLSGVIIGLAGIGMSILKKKKRED
uniref:Ig-like domain-containing protein n=1 Tax=Parvimonas micra TaxID=33033 RepID=UPI00241C288F